MRRFINYLGDIACCFADHITRQILRIEVLYWSKIYSIAQQRQRNYTALNLMYYRILTFSISLPSCLAFPRHICFTSNKSIDTRFFIRSKCPQYSLQFFLSNRRLPVLKVSKKFLKIN